MHQEFPEKKHYTSVWTSYTHENMLGIGVTCPQLLIACSISRMSYKDILESIGIVQIDLRLYKLSVNRLRAPNVFSFLFSCNFSYVSSHATGKISIKEISQFASAYSETERQSLRKGEGWKIARMELGARYDLGAALGPVIHAALRIHAYTRHGVSDVHTVVRPATAAFHGLPKLRPIPYTPRALSSLSSLFHFSSSSPVAPPAHTSPRYPPSAPPMHPFTTLLFFLTLHSRSLVLSFLPSAARESRPSILVRNLHILSPFFSFSHFLSVRERATPGTIPSASPNFIRSRDFTRLRALCRSRGALILFRHRLRIDST